MKNGAIAFLGAAAVASVASADFIGWTANVREATGGGYLINVYAVTNDAADVILNVYGGSPGQPTAGFITTTSAGGFLQEAGSRGTFAPSGSQNWNTLDSFLTVGGGLTSTGNWTGNGSTAGDPPWNVTYFNTSIEENETVNSFNTNSNEEGFTNPNLNSIPATAGWFIAGSTSPARSLAGLANRVASSSEEAAAGSFGMMVAQLYVMDLQLDWKMGASLKRANGSVSQGTFEFSIGEIPAPGALALLGVAGLASGRRRRA
jgi:hypothetical protein